MVQEATQIGAEDLPAQCEPPYLGNDKIESVNSLDELEQSHVEEGEGFFACLARLVKLMANIHDSGGRRQKCLKCHQKRSLMKCATNVSDKNLSISFGAKCF